MQPDADAVYAKVTCRGAKCALNKACLLASTTPQPSSYACCQTLRLDLASVMPYVSGPNSVKVMSRIDTISQERIPVNKAYLVSCVNARVSDLKAAADVLRNKTIAPVSCHSFDYLSMHANRLAIHERLCYQAH